MPLLYSHCPATAPYSHCTAAAQPLPSLGQPLCSLREFASAFLSIYLRTGERDEQGSVYQNAVGPSDHAGHLQGLGRCKDDGLHADELDAAKNRTSGLRRQSVKCVGMCLDMCVDMCADMGV